MSAVAILASQALLVLAVLCARPPRTGDALRGRLLVQAGLLALALLARALSDGAFASSLCCLLAVSGEMAALAGFWHRWPEPSPPPSSAGWWPVAACVPVVWLAFRLLPGQVSPVPPAALGIVLCATAALAAAPSGRSRQAALLLAGHGVLLFVGTSRGAGWPGAAMAVLLQGAVLSGFCRRPVWSGEAGEEPVQAATGRGSP